MRKLIDISDELLDALKQAAVKEHRSVKSWIEHLVITTLKQQNETKYKRTRKK